MKFKNFYTARNTIKKVKTQATNWKQIFLIQIFDKDYASRIYKEFLEINKKKTKTSLKDFCCLLRIQRTRKNIAPTLTIIMTKMPGQDFFEPIREVRSQENKLV